MNEHGNGTAVTINEPRYVYLSSGYRIDRHEQDWPEHLCNAAAGEAIEQIRSVIPPEKQRWDTVYDCGTMEMFYVAGQLKQAGSLMGLSDLLPLFRHWWDQTAGRVQCRWRRADADTRPSVPHEKE